jgi:hypothetical protein
MSPSQVEVILRRFESPVETRIMEKEMRTADRDLLTAAISFTVAAFVVFSRRNPLWALGAGTCVSIVALYLSRFH